MAKILCVTGSLREKSHTRRLIKLVAGHIEEFGGEARILDLNETPLGLLNPDRADPNKDKIREMVMWADAFVLGSPDYHGSLSGTIKNFLDYFWGEFTGKLFGYVVSSHEKGLTVHDQMRTAVRQCYGWSMPYGLSVNGDADLDTDGNLKDPKLASRAKMLARDLVIYGGMLNEQFQTDLAREPRDPGFAENFKL